MFRPALIMLVLAAATGAHAGDAAPLLQRALSCRLADDELASLPAKLAAADPSSFAKPAPRRADL